MTKDVAHSGFASIPSGEGEWEVGQHPAVSDGWIVRPVLFGSRVRVLPEWEGGHVILKSEADARLISAAREMYAVLYEMFCEGPVDVAFAGSPIAIEALERRVRAALDKAST